MADEEEVDQAQIDAAIKIQRVTRGHRGRIQAFGIREEIEEARRRVPNSGWGYDNLANVHLSNAKTCSAPRLMGSSQQYAMEIPVTQTVVVTYNGDKNEQGLYSGQGEATFVNGHSYKGTWAHGLMHGAGEFKWSDGVKYRGPMVSGRIQGKGQLVWPGGNAYDGEVLDGYRHGKGKFVMVMDSDEIEDDSAVITYEGYWFRGRRNGQGTLMYDSDGKQKYIGEWKDDTRNGYGKMYYRSGNVYKGQWRSDKHHGQGQMKWYTRNEFYTGTWDDGLPHGKGEHVWFMEVHPGTSFQTLNRYVGDWVAGVREGQGFFEYADGSRYQGEWANNQKEGLGHFAFADGHAYNGKFSKDKMLDYKKPSKSLINPGAGEVVLQIPDLLSSYEDAGKELLRIKNILVQYMSELKQIFRYYCQTNAPEAKLNRTTSTGRAMTPEKPSISNALVKMPEFEGAVENVFAMSMLDFWKFCKDCRIPDPKLTLAEIDRIFLRVEKKASESNDIADIHNPSKKLVFRSFLEALVRLADTKYQDFTTTSDRLNHMVYHNILPFACQEQDDDFKGKLESLECKHVVAFFEPYIRQLFKSWCGEGSETMKLADCLTILKSAQLVDDSLGHSEIVELYYKGLNMDVNQTKMNKTNIEPEVIFEEVYEILLRLGDKKNNEKSAQERISKFLKSLVPTVEVPPMPKPGRRAFVGGSQQSNISTQGSQGWSFNQSSGGSSFARSASSSQGNSFGGRRPS